MLGNETAPKGVGAKSPGLKHMILVKLLAIKAVHSYKDRVEFEGSLDAEYNKKYPELFEITEVEPPQRSL